MKSKVFGFVFLTLICGAALVLLLDNGMTKETLQPAKTDASHPQVVAAYGKLPLAFEINKGQTDSQVKFLSRGSGYTLFLTGREAVLEVRKPSGFRPQGPGITDPKYWTGNPTQRRSAPARPPDSRIRLLDLGLLPIDLHPSAMGISRVPNPQLQTTAVMRIKLEGANSAAKVVGAEELPGRSNYFLGRDPRKWRTGVANYAKVRYKDVYPGVDVVYYGNQGKLEHDFVVSPGADPAAINLAIEGAGSLRLDHDGNLVAQLNSGDMVLRKPTVYQPGNPNSEIQNPKSVDGRFVLLADNRIGFEVGIYDKTKPLIIDPVLTYSTYLGGNGHDSGWGIAVDTAGNAYVTGMTSSSDFPTVNPLQPGFGGGYDVFVSKLNAAGSALVYSTYLGGSDDDFGSGIAVDTTGNAFVTGSTASLDFPTANPLQGAYGGGSIDAFVSKLNPTGSALVYSTYLGGTGYDYGDSIVVDTAGNAFIAGSTSSPDFPTVNSLQSAFGGGPYDAFVAKFNPAGSALVYSTYLGGTGEDDGTSIALDGAGNAYLTGLTSSPNFPTAHPMQGAFGGGPYDAFVAKFNPAGSALVYSTYLGGSDFDTGVGIAVDAAGSAYVTGGTASTNFPTATPLQGSLLGSKNAFVAKLSSTGSALVYSTYLGGKYWDVGYGIAVDAAGNAYVTGLTGSSDFPTINPLQPSLGGGYDAFVSKFNAAGSALIYSTYLGGSNDDMNLGFAADSTGNAFVTGYTQSADFPTAKPLQANLVGSPSVGLDAFVAKISPAPGLVLSSNSLSFGSQNVSSTSAEQSVTLTNPGDGLLSVTGIAVSGDFTLATTATSCPYSGGSVAAQADCTIDVTFTPFASGARSGTLTITDNVASSPQTIGLSGTGQDFTLAAPSGTSTSATVTRGQNATYTLSVGGQGGMSGTVTFTCTGAPSEATCTISPNPVTAGSTATNVTVTVTTTAASVSAPRSRPFPPLPPLPPGLSGLVMLALILAAIAWVIGRRNRRSVSRWRSAIALLAGGLLLTLALAGCGGGGGGGGGVTHNSGTPGGTYTLTVTGTTGSGSSALSHSVALTLTVS